jgi:hypothetical protein
MTQEASISPTRTGPIRPCVIERGLDNCATCGDYPCAKLEERMAGVEEVVRRFFGKIPQEEYDNFIAPYDTRKNIEWDPGKARGRKR